MPREAVRLLYGALEGSSSRKSFNNHVAQASPVDLTRIDLSCYDLRGLVFANCQLDGACLNECRASGVDFREASLLEANLSGADLREACLDHASCQGADFRRARLVDTDFSWADLRESDLRDADLSRARLWKSDLRFARFDPFDSRGQDFRVESHPSDPPEQVTVSESLELIARALGATCVIPPGLGGAPIVLPRDFQENPRVALRRLAARLGLDLRVCPSATGDVESFEICPPA